MAYPSSERYMPDERRPSPCGCAGDEDESAYTQSFYDRRGAPVRIYGGGSGKYTMMTVVIVALVALIVGYLCSKFEIPMRFFNKGGGGEMSQRVPL